jgi:hypothetical protein
MNYPKKKNSSKKTDYKVSKNQIRQMIKSSQRQNALKVIDFTYVNTIGTATVFVALPMPPQGVLMFQRTGDEIEIDHFEMRLNLYVADPTNLFRVCLLQYIGRQTAVPAASDVFAVGSSGVIDVTSFYKPLIVGETFRVLFDKLIPLNQNSSTAQWTVHLGKMVPSIKSITFDATTVNAYTGQCYFALITDSGVVPSPAIDIMFRTFFRDA